MERAGLDLDRHIVERVKRPEDLGHADRFERRRPLCGIVDDDWCDGVHGSASRKAGRRGDGAEHAALHLDHVDRGEMVLDLGRAAAVREQQALVAAVVGVAHRRVHADVGGDAGEDDVADALRPQHEFEVGGEERALARLVDDGLARLRLQFRDDLPARLAAHEDAAARTLVADAGADPLRAPALVGRQVGEVGLVALAGVDDRVALGAHGLEHVLDRHDRRAGQRDVVAHRVDIAAGRAEIGLHVDDDQAVLCGPKSPSNGQG